MHKPEVRIAIALTFISINITFFIEFSKFAMNHCRLSKYLCDTMAGNFEDDILERDLGFYCEKIHVKCFLQV